MNEEQDMKNVVLFFLLTAILQGCGNQMEEHKLLATIQSTNQHLLIENGDHFVWENPVITVNEEYFYHMEYIPRGKISITYHLFKNESGIAFQPGILKVRKVEILVPKSDGEEHLFYTW